MAKRNLPGDALIFIPQVFITRLRVKAMNDSTKEKAEKERVLRKLIKKWRTTQGMTDKAKQLLSRNPGLKNAPAAKSSQMANRNGR